MGKSDGQVSERTLEGAFAAGITDTNAAVNTIKANSEDNSSPYGVTNADLESLRESNPDAYNAALQIIEEEG